MAYDPNNVFAQILRGTASRIPVYEDDATLAFMDIIPCAPDTRYRPHASIRAGDERLRGMAARIRACLG